MDEEREACIPQTEGAKKAKIPSKRYYGTLLDAFGQSDALHVGGVHGVADVGIGEFNASVF